MEQRSAGRAGAGLPKLHDSLPGCGQGGQGKDDYRQESAARPQQQSAVRQGYKGAVRLNVKEERAENARRRWSQECSDYNRRNCQQQALYQHHQAYLQGGGAPALEHRDFGAAGTDGQPRYQGQVISQNAGNQKDHQEKGNAGQEEQLRIAVQ